MRTDTLKIVHISTSARGGAGIAAFRIHTALLKKGINSYFLSLDTDTEIEKYTSYNPLDNSFSSKLLGKLRWRLKNHFNIIINKRESIISDLGIIIPKIECEIATLPFSEYDILKHPAIHSADIIHLHWVAGMLDYPTFFKHNSKPIVWTLHDMNPFQGMYHYEEDQLRNEKISSVLDTKLKELKEKAIRKSKHKLSVVAPSGWLLTKAVSSKAFKNVKGYRITNPLNMDSFCRRELVQLRSKLNISKENIVFLFVAQDVANHRKGFDLLLGALSVIQTNQITFLVIGENTAFDILGLDVRFLGTVNDNEKLSEYYSLADAFIIPSREDNLPNVMLESMACGTPVISFNVGGMKEIIQDKFNGLKAPEVTIDSLAKTLLNFISIKEQFNAEKIRAFAESHFSFNVIAPQYIELYKKSLLV